MQPFQWFFILFIAPQSISSQCFNYGKTGILVGGTLGSNRKITAAKHGPVFLKKSAGWIDVAGNKSRVVVIKLSIKFFPFFSNLTSALLTLRIALYTYWSSKKQFLN